MLALVLWKWLHQKRYRVENWGWYHRIWVAVTKALQAYLSQSYVTEAHLWTLPQIPQYLAVLDKCCIFINLISKLIFVCGFKATLSVGLGTVAAAANSCNHLWDLKWKEEDQPKSPQFNSGSCNFIEKNGLKRSLIKNKQCNWKSLLADFRCSFAPFS